MWVNRARSLNSDNGKTSVTSLRRVHQRLATEFLCTNPSRNRVGRPISLAPKSVTRGDKFGQRKMMWFRSRDEHFTHENKGFPSTTRRNESSPVNSSHSLPMSLRLADGLLSLVGDNAKAPSFQVRDSQISCLLAYQPKEVMGVLSCVIRQNPTDAPWQKKNDIDRVTA